MPTIHCNLITDENYTCSSGAGDFDFGGGVGSGRGEYQDKMTEDKILLTAMSHGSVKAFDALYRKYAPKVGGFATALLSNGGFSRDDSDDLVQEIFLKIWQKRTTLAHDVDNFNAYLFRMTRNAVLNILQRQKTMHCALETSDDQPGMDDVFARTLASEAEDAINRAVGKMPDERKKVFLMSRYEGLPNKEIAAELKISPKTVEYHIGRALSDIKKNLN